MLTFSMMIIIVAMCGYTLSTLEERQRVKDTVKIVVFMLNPFAPLPKLKPFSDVPETGKSYVIDADVPKRTIRKRYTRSDAVLYTNDLLFETDTVSLRDGAKIRIRFYDAEEPIDFDYIPAPR